MYTRFFNKPLILYPYTGENRLIKANLAILKVTIETVSEDDLAEKAAARQLTNILINAINKGIILENQSGELAEFISDINLLLTSHRSFFLLYDDGKKEKFEKLLEQFSGTVKENSFWGRRFNLERYDDVMYTALFLGVLLLLVALPITFFTGGAILPVILVAGITLAGGGGMAGVKKLGQTDPLSIGLDLLQIYKNRPLVPRGLNIPAITSPAVKGAYS